MIVVTDGRVSLRASAYVELHLWLAAAARGGQHVEPELEPARRAYARSLADDDEDRLLYRTTRALSACSDDRCASGALASEGFGSSFDRALPPFLERSWQTHAAVAWAGIEAAHAVLAANGAVFEDLFTRATRDLGITWPEEPVGIDVVSETPPVGRAALAPTAIATRGRCFARERRPGRQNRSASEDRVDQARILDCLLVHALLAASTRDARGPLRQALARELGDHDAERAWELLVLHSVALVVTGWEPRHRSVYRRSAEAVEEPMLEWLAKEWHGGASDPPHAFARRYAARFREAHP